MKLFFVLCATLIAVAYTKADTQALDLNDISKKLAETLSDLSKKWEESTGMKADFDKEKFLRAAKSFNEQLSQSLQKVKDAYAEQIKNYPNADELKKRLEQAQTQVQEVIKNLNSPDVQKSADKLKDVVTTGMKKSSEGFNELLTKLGVAPPPSIQKLLSEMADDVSRNASQLQAKFNKIIEEAQAELKKKKN